jgi:hypothetical protein
MQETRLYYKMFENPITFTFDVAKKAHPDLEYDFAFAYLGDEELGPKEYSGPWGQTDFDGEFPTILVDPRLPICAFPEIFMHELAHVIVGFDAGHEEAWENEFKKLEEFYNQVFEELHADPDA